MITSRFVRKAAALLSFGALLFPGSARAHMFGLSYYFQDGSKVLGGVEADWGSVYLENLRYAFWTYYLPDGTRSVTGVADENFLDLAGPQLIPVDGGIDGLRIDFEQDTNGLFDFNFSVGPAFVSVAAPSLDWTTQYDHFEATGEGWDLARPPGVPEPGSTFGLLGLAVVALIAASSRLPGVAVDRGSRPAG